MIVFYFVFLKSFSHSISASGSSGSGFLHSNSQVFNSEKIKKVYSLLEKNFYWFNQKTYEEIENGMVSSLVSSLGDKHSEYFTPEENEEFQTSLSGNFYGIGAVVDEHELWAKIARVIEDSPAEKSGLLAGDIVISVDEKSIEWMSASDAVKLIRWEKWTAVKLGIYRDGIKKSLQIIRDEVNIPSVDGEMLENSEIGYIQVNSFGEKTPIEFHGFITDLTASGAKWLIVDLRFNGGGYIDSAQTMLSEFLPKNTAIVTTKENDPRKNDTLYTNFLTIPNTKIPLVILVNELSASASEIVAGALQDYERAIIVGTKTYGKWSVQQMFDLGDGSMAKFTIARWYTPKDKNIDLEGIHPDITIELTEEDFNKKQDGQLLGAEKVMKSLLEGKSRTEIIESFSSKKSAE